MSSNAISACGCSNRIRQRVVLTDGGRLYLSDVRRALDDSRARDAQGRGLLQQLDPQSRGDTDVRLALADSAPPGLPERHPRILVHLTTQQRPQDMALEPFDAVVFFGSPNWPGTISHHLMDLKMVAVCSPKLKANAPSRRRPTSSNSPLLHQMARPNRWAELMAEAGVAQSGPLHGHTYQFSLLPQAAVAGLGIALLPRYLVEEELADHRLEIVGHDFLEARTTYYLMVPEARASATALVAFTTWLISEAQDWTAANGHLAYARVVKPR